MNPNIPLLAAEIARRVPAMAQDSVVNNEQMLKGLLEQEFEPSGTVTVKPTEPVDGNEIAMAALHAIVTNSSYGLERDFARELYRRMRASECPRVVKISGIS